MCRSMTLWVTVMFIGVLFSAVSAQAQEPLKVGEHYEIHVDSQGSSDVKTVSTATGKVYVLTHPGATYMSVHFAKFDLTPGDFMIVSDADGEQGYTMEGKGKMKAGTFWSQHVKGDTIMLQLVTTGENPGKGFVINKYGAGIVEFDPATERICGDNDFENAICRAGTTEYDNARAVARLLIEGRYLCTGWLASADSHLITNEHCISSSRAALDTDYEFMAEAPNCKDPNGQLSYTGTIYSGASFIQDDVSLDYALIQLAGNPALTHGYLEIDNRDAIVGEEIYQPAHPAGRAKEFGWYCDQNTPYASGRCKVISLTEPGCSSSSYKDVGYWADTEGGSSGSPVLAVSSHKVIALHHCHNYCDQGGDPNRGVPIDLICAEIGAYIPSCTGSGFCGDGVCDVTEDQCNCDADCGNPPLNEVGLCDDGVDNDCDGATDCNDDECSQAANCLCNDNGTCELGEDCNNCPGDCISGGGFPGCGNGTCEPGEDCNSCPADCRAKTVGKPSLRYCCDGDLPDCGSPKCSEDGWSCGSSDPYCCGDGTCEGKETACNCSDCGEVPSEVPGLTCNDGIDNDCDGDADCQDPDCDTDPVCTTDCLQRGEPCDLTNDLCCNGCHPIKLTCK